MTARWKHWPEPQAHVRRWFDRITRSWCVQSIDAEGNQIGEATYVGSRREALAEEKERRQALKNIFKKD
jgi:hypothetical protein